MKAPSALKLGGLLCFVFILNACQKEDTVNNFSNPAQNSSVRLSGSVTDDPRILSKVPTIVSSEFYSDYLTKSAKGGPKADTDGDGILDVNDACPTQKETVNGYQDADGCPDVAPTTATDSDGDGIADANDACPTQKETVNGYQDSDGCPDTVPDTDGDGINDLVDGCPTQPETFNGYQDTDGCPDTAPVVMAPTTLPSSISLQMPPVGNQGSEFSCVSFAVGYAARSAEVFYSTNASSYSFSTNIFSPEFLYNQTKAFDCGSGSAITTALEFLKNTGISTWQTMPYSDLNGCTQLPNSNQLAEAATFKINTYSAVYKSDVTAIKNMLVNKHPLITSVNLDESFTNAQPGFIWKAFSGAGGFNHVLVICGYDDAKHAFKVMNSWGTGWGDAGFSWIDYDFLNQTGGTWAFIINA